MHTLSAAINLKNKSFGQLKGFDFNSFCNFGGRTFCSSDFGLFEIVGSTDNEEEIPAWFDTVLSDWGTSRLKRPRAVLLSGEFEAGIALEILNGKDEVLAELSLGEGAPGGSIFVFQKTAPRTTSGRYFKFRIKNVDGSFIHVDQLEVLFTLRPYGTTKSS